MTADLGWPDELDPVFVEWGDETHRDYLESVEDDRDEFCHECGGLGYRMRYQLLSDGTVSDVWREPCSSCEAVR